MLSDKTLRCVECGSNFTFTVGEQEFFASKGFTNEPSRCSQCRGARRSQQGGSGGFGGSGGEGPEGPEGHHEKCIQQFALSAGLTLWFHLDRVATGRYTVAIASAQ